MLEKQIYEGETMQISEKISPTSYSGVDYIWIVGLSIYYAFGIAVPHLHGIITLLLFTVMLFYSKFYFSRRAMMSTLWILVFAIYGFAVAYIRGYGSWEYVKSLIENILLVAAAGIYAKDEKTFRNLLQDFSVAVLFFAVVLLATSPISSWGTLNFQGITTQQRNTSAYLLGIAAVIFAWDYLGKKDLIFLILSLFCTMVMILTGSRKMLFSLLVPIVLFFIAKKHTKKSLSRALLIAFILGAVVALLSFLPLMQSIYGKRLIYIFDYLRNQGSEDSSVAVRIQMQRKGWECFVEKPIFGWGLGVSRWLVYTGMRVYAYFHNNFIELLACTGILGFSVYLFPFVRTLAVTWRNRQNDLGFLLLCLTSMYLLLSLGQVTIYYGSFYLIIFFIVQYGIIQGRFIGKTIGRR